MLTLSYGQHGQPGKGVMHCWHCLYIGGQYLCMFPYVEHECITGPSTFDLHDIKGDAPQQILKGGTNSDTVTLEGLQTSGACGFGELSEEPGLCEGSVPVFVMVHEEVTFPWGVVDLEVMG